MEISEYISVFEVSPDVLSLPAEGILSPRKQRIPVGNLRYDLPIMLFWSCVAILTVTSLGYLQIDWGKVIARMGHLGTVLGNLTHLSFESFDLVMIGFLESVTVTILATIYGLLIGLVLGGLAAENITPYKPLSWILQAVFSFIRAVPTTVWVLLVLVCLGFSPATGIVGLLFHVIAFFGRVFAQCFEEVPAATIEALRASGANRLQIFFGAILPASFTALIAWCALRFETNFSESAILGMVGAGGIGYTIMASMSRYQFGRAGTAILMVFIFALSLEIVLTKIKRKLRV